MHHVGKSQKTVMKWQFFAPQPVPIAIESTRDLHFLGKNNGIIQKEKPRISAGFAPQPGLEPGTY